MAVIDFLPDRLNNPRGLERVHIRGVCAGGRHRCYCRYPSGNTVSSGSFCRMAGFSDVHAADAAVGHFFGGNWIASYKRGKPENYIWQRLEELRCRARMSRTMILDSRAWELKRTKPVPLMRGGKV